MSWVNVEHRTFDVQLRIWYFAYLYNNGAKRSPYSMFDGERSMFDVQLFLRESLGPGFITVIYPTRAWARSYTSACICTSTGQRGHGPTDKGCKGESLPRGFALAFT